MSTSSKTSTTPTTAAAGTSPSSTVRPGLRVGEHVCAVQFAVWGPQVSSVKASSGGGRGGAPYVVVQVGASLTYAYDQAAIESYVRAWEAAERINATVRLPEFAPSTASRRQPGEDLSVLCNVTAEQRTRVVSTTGADGARSSPSRSAPSPCTCTPPVPCAPTSPPGAGRPPSPGCWRTAEGSSAHTCGPALRGRAAGVRTIPSTSLCPQARQRQPQSVADDDRLQG